MKNNFSLRRWWLLIKKQAAENYKFYLLATTALALILAIVFIFWYFNARPSFREDSIYMIYIFGLIIAGGLFASFSFQQLTTKDKAVYYLSFPASTTEKLSAELFFNVIVFPLIYTLVFYIVKSIFWTYILSQVNGEDHFTVSYLDSQDRNGFMQAFPYFFYVFFAIQAFYFLGAVYFSRYSFIKTTIIGFAIIFLFAWYFNDVIRHQFQEFDPSLSFTRFDPSGTGHKKYELSASTRQVIYTSFRLMWAPVFWVCAFFRLKEKEV